MKSSRLLKLGRTWLHPDRCRRTGELYERGIWQWRPTERDSFRQYATTALVETATLQRMVYVQVKCTKRVRKGENSLVTVTIHTIWHRVLNC